jgi:hypothetical protein
VARLVDFSCSVGLLGGVVGLLGEVAGEVGLPGEDVVLLGEVVGVVGLIRAVAGVVGLLEVVGLLGGVTGVVGLLGEAVGHADVNCAVGLLVDSPVFSSVASTSRAGLCSVGLCSWASGLGVGLRDVDNIRVRVGLRWL